MQITDLKVKRVKSDSNMKGIAHVTFDNILVIHDIKIIVPPASSEKGPFIAMPSKRNRKTGKWTDYVHPIKDNNDPAARDLRKEMQTAIFEIFNNLPEEEAETVEAEEIENFGDVE